MENQLHDVVRQVKVLQSQLNTLLQVNNVQTNAFVQLHEETDYNGQVERINTEITQLKG